MENSADIFKTNFNELNKDGDCKNVIIALQIT